MVKEEQRYSRADCLDDANTIAEITGCADCFATGSALFYGDGADCDVVVACDGGAGLRNKRNALQAAGFESSASVYDNSDMLTMRRGRINAILINDESLVDKWERATLAALMLRDVGVVLDKKQRAALFEAVKHHDPAQALDDREEYVNDATL